MALKFFWTQQGQPTTRDKFLALLRTHKTTPFGVNDLTQFGSFARDQLGEDSDLDILFHFDRRATSKHYFGT
ncbi:MAG: nucleotidyltransferase domain-containing protein [Rhodospirillales bacterium]|nr:nucleotidyltransferase domain-containing protein [Rhodospirillales bacterium]